jgi:RNA polymerase sigma-70 factor (ECF subfamily)
MSIEAFKSRVLPAKDKMYRFALRFLRDEEEAKDIVQEAMIRVWKKREEMHTYHNMEAWCMTIVRNLSLDRIKSKQYNSESLDQTYDLSDRTISPDRSTEIDDTMENIHHFIANLPQKQRQIIQLRDIEGFSYQEIGKILNLDANNVKVNLFRARKSVKENLLKINAYGLK